MTMEVGLKEDQIRQLLVIIEIRRANQGVDHYSPYLLPGWLTRLYLINPIFIMNFMMRCVNEGFSTRRSES